MAQAENRPGIEALVFSVGQGFAEIEYHAIYQTLILDPTALENFFGDEIARDRFLYRFIDCTTRLIHFLLFAEKRLARDTINASIVGSSLLKHIFLRLLSFDELFQEPSQVIALKDLLVIIMRILMVSAASSSSTIKSFFYQFCQRGELLEVFCADKEGASILKNLVTYKGDKTQLKFLDKGALPILVQRIVAQITVCTTVREDLSLWIKIQGISTENTRMKRHSILIALFTAD